MTKYISTTIIIICLSLQTLHFFLVGVCKQVLHKTKGKVMDIVTSEKNFRGISIGNIKICFRQKYKIETNKQQQQQEKQK